MSCSSGPLQAKIVIQPFLPVHPQCFACIRSAQCRADRMRLHIYYRFLHTLGMPVSIGFLSRFGFWLRCRLTNIEKHFTMWSILVKIVPRCCGDVWVKTAVFYAQGVSPSTIFQRQQLTLCSKLVKSKPISRFFVYRQRSFWFWVFDFGITHFFVSTTVYCILVPNPAG